MSTRPISIAIAIACVAAAALLASSCRTSAPACGQSATLVIAVRDGAGAAYMPSRLFTELSLVERNEPGVMLPGLAESWTWSDGGRTWTFKIRAPLPTHGGARLTADHIKTSMLAQRRETMTFDPVSQDIVSIEAPSPETLVIRLARPTRAIIDSLRTINPAGEVRGLGLGTGPYRLAAQSADRIDYEAFPDFAGGAPALRAVRTRVYASARLAWAAFLRREVDMLYEAPPSVAEQLAQHPDVRLFPVVSGHQYVWGFQLKAPRLRDVRVRRALNMAIDREALAKQAFGGYARPSRGPFSPAYAMARDLEPTTRYDLAGARAELAAAHGGRARPLVLECLVIDQDAARAPRLVAALESQLAQIGVRLSLVPLPPPEFARRLAAGEFETYVAPMAILRTQLWPYIFWHSRAPRPFARSDYNAADAALDAAYGAMDDDSERAAVRQVQQIMRDDPPAAFLTMVPMIRAVRRRWQLPPAENLPPDLVPEIRESIRLWTLAPSECRP